MDTRLRSERLHRRLLILIGLGCLLPILSLLGWYTGNPLLSRALPDHPAMSANTAISFLLCGVSLLYSKSRLRWITLYSLFYGALIIFLLIEVASFFEPLLNARWDILRLPTLLVSKSPTVTSSPHTALAISSLLVATILLSRNPYGANSKTIYGIQILSIIAFSTALIGTFGYLTQQRHLFQFNPGLGMSIPTIITTTCISLALFLHFPNQGLNQEVFDRGSGGTFLRRFLLLTAISVILIFIVNSLSIPLRYQFLPTLFSISVVVSLLLGLFLLATRLNHAERLKANAERHYYSIFEASPDGLLLADSDGVILEANRQMELLTGYAKDQLLSSTVELLIPKALHNHHRGLRKNFINSNRSDRPMSSALVIALCNSNQEEIPVSISITTVLEDNKTHFIIAIRDQREQQEIKERLNTLHHEAMHDPLTKLPNRNLLSEFSERVFSLAKRSNTMVAVCFCDLDGFKNINDNYGHLAGDELLNAIAKRLKDSVREQDIVARYGGDEFIILLTGLRCEQDAERSINSLLETIPAPVIYKEHHLSVTVSVGVSFYPQHGENLTELEKKADSSLYHAKRDGKNTYSIHAPA